MVTAMVTAMVLEFLSPWWVLAAVAVAGIGLAAVWMLGLMPMPVSTLQFWQAGVGESGKKDSRKIDPLWLLVAIAATIAALALMQPTLQIPSAPRTAQTLSMVCAGRAMPEAQIGSIFVRSKGMVHATRPLLLQVSWPGGKQVRRVSGAELHAGLTLAGIPITQKVWQVSLMAAGKVLWHQTLAQRKRATLAVNLVGTPPAALARFLHVARDIVLDRPELHPALWILTGRNAIVSRSALADGDGILAVAPALLPGIQLIAAHRVRAGTGKTTAELRLRKESSDKFLAHVAFHATRVRAIYPARMDAQWQVLVRVVGGGPGINGRPVIAMRYETKPAIRQIWIGFPLQVSSTTWPEHSSFVIFFANVLAQLHAEGSGGHFGTEWVAPRSRRRLAAPSVQPRVMALAGYLELVAGVMVLGAMVGLVRRFPPGRATP